MSAAGFSASSFSAAAAKPAAAEVLRLLSQRACDSLDRMMLSGLRQSLVPGDAGAVIETVDAVPPGAATHMAVLSIASFPFRLNTALHFARTEALLAWAARRAGMEEGAEPIGEQQFIDVICEVGNLCCGSINRDLGEFQSFLGLSTPQILDVRCLPHFVRDGAEHLRHFRVQVQPDLTLYASLCARAYLPQDFHWSGPPAEAAVESGELEMF